MLQSLLIQLDKPLKSVLDPVQAIGYPRVIRCFCGANFRHWKAFANHCEKKHSVEFDKNQKTLNEELAVKLGLKYEFITVDSGYLLERMIECQTTEICFEHKHEARDFCDNKLTVLGSCYLRCCPKCIEARKRRYAKLFRSTIESFERIAVLTLTFKDSHALSKAKMQEFRNHVCNFMRRLRYHKSYEIKFIRVLEIVPKADGWYYHYHILIDMPYIKQDILSRMWKEVTGDSFVVWIEVLKNNNGVPIGHLWKRLSNRQKVSNALNYVAKYLSKPLPSDDLDQYAVSVYGQHFTQSSLTCKKGQKSTKKKCVKCSECGGNLFFSSQRVVIGSDSEKSKDYQLCLSEVVKNG